jgi:hypothetical protein
MALQGIEGGVNENVVGIVSIIVIFVVFPLVLAYARMIWRRGSAAPAQLSNDTSHRLIQMQHSIDAMAVEMERISENQRFVTKLLAERGSAQAAPQDASSRSGRAAG